MKEWMWAGIALAAAFILHSLVTAAFPALSLILNTFSVVVIYFAVRNGGIFGAVYGTLCGLLQDSFSLGIFGVAGLSKTVLGYLAGTISQRVQVTPFVRRLLFSAVLIFGEVLIWSLLLMVFFSEKPPLGEGMLALQPLISALAVCALFAAVPWIRSRLELRKEKRHA